MSLPFAFLGALLFGVRILSTDNWNSILVVGEGRNQCSALVRLPVGAKSTVAESDGSPMGLLNSDKDERGRKGRRGKRRGKMRY